MSQVSDQTKLGQFDRTIRHCEVIDIPAGAAPKYVSVQLPGSDGAVVDAWWDGSPRLTVGGFVKLLRGMDTPQYEITGTSGSTAGLPAEHTHPASDIVSGTMSTARLGSGTANSSTFLRGDQTWATPAAGGGWPFANILTVSAADPDANHPTIQDAIDSVAAGSSAAILPDPGSYAENLTIDSKNIALISLGGDPRFGSGNYAVSIGGSVTINTTTNDASATIANCSITGAITADTAATGNIIYLTLQRIDSQSASLNRLTLTNNVQCWIDNAQLITTSGNVIVSNVSDASYSLSIWNSNIVNTIAYNAGTLNIDEFSLSGVTTISGAGTVVLRETQKNAGVWLIDESRNLRIKYDTLTAAVTAAAAGDKIKLFADTYTITGAALSLSKSIEVEGDGVGATVITSALSNSPTIDVTADNVTFRNLTIQHTGTGTTAGPLSTDNANLTLDNVYLDKTSGASTTSYGLWMYGGSAALKNGTRVSCTAGTDKYGILNTTASATITIFGGQVGGATYDIYGDQAGSTLGLNDPILVNGYSSWAGDVTGQYHGTKLVTNSSGATAPGRDAGYIDANGDYVTTTTANYFKEASNCVVVISGGSTKKCFVATEGRWPIRYTGSDPADGDFLVTSTTGGAAAAQATMLPEIFARCQAAGASNVVTALLMTGTKFVPATNANDIYRCASHSNSDFVATINGAPTATSVVYNAPSSGAANVIVPNGTILGQLVLWNSTRSTGRLITAVDTGTSTITTVSTTDAWASGDTITFRSVTIADSNTARYGEIDLSNQTAVPPLARAISLTVIKEDTGGITFVLFHPIEAFAASKQSAAVWNLSAGNQNHGVRNVPLINRRFGWRSGASGSGTATDTLRLAGYWMATP